MATILRHREAAPHDTAPRPAAFTLSDMASQGDDYVHRIRQEAATIISEAKAEADRIRKAAEAEGRAAADEHINRLLDERVGGKLETLRPALDGVVNELRVARGEWLEHWRGRAVALAAKMAERLVRRELEKDPAIGEAWLTEALTLAAGASDLTVRLAPIDYEHLRGHAERLAESMGGLGEARFLSDDSITPGGCRVETRHGAIDQQLETQLDRLTEELT